MKAQSRTVPLVRLAPPLTAPTSTGGTQWMGYALFETGHRDLVPVLTSYVAGAGTVDFQ